MEKIESIEKKSTEANKISLSKAAILAVLLGVWWYLIGDMKGSREYNEGLRTWVNAGLKAGISIGVEAGINIGVEKTIKALETLTLDSIENNDEAIDSIPFQKHPATSDIKYL